MLPTRFALLTLTALALPAAAQAQHVSADIAIDGGPVAGRILVGDPYYPTYHYRPAYREVVVVRGHRGNGWYRHHGAQVVVYYDADRDCYYDRDWHRGLREMVVYQDGGRYYRDDYRDDYRNDYPRRVRGYDDDRYRYQDRRGYDDRGHGRHRDRDDDDRD